MVGVVEIPLADIIFIIEGTATNGAYLNDIKTNYIIPTLEYFSPGTLEEREYVSDSTNAMFGIVIYHAADRLPSPSTDVYGPYTTGHKVLQMLDKLEMVGGRGESHANIAEALAASMVCLEDLTQRREAGASPQKHCVLICNSPPYLMPVTENQAFVGSSAEQLAGLFTERNINLSVLSPRKIPALFKLYEKAGGDLSASQTKNYAKDPRHLVLLKGFSLKERPLSPPGNPPHLPNVASLASPLASGVGSPMGQPQPNQQQPQPQMMQPGPQPQLQASRAFPGYHNPVRPPTRWPMMPPQQRPPAFNQQGSALIEQLTRPPTAMAPSFNNSPGINPGVGLSPQQQAAVQQQAAAAQQQAAVAQQQAQQAQMRLIGNQGVMQPQMGQPSQSAMQQPQQVSMVQPGVQGVPGVQGAPGVQGVPSVQGVMGPQQMMQQQQQMQQQNVMQQQQQQMQQPQQIQQQQQMQQQNVMQQQSVMSQPGQVMGQPSSTVQRATIWSGTLEWIEKPKNPNDPQKLTREVPCSVSANTKDGEQELKTDSWPPKLIMQLMPKQLIGNIGGAHLKNSKSVLFHPNPCEALDVLTKVMISGFAGCVHFSHVSTCDIKVLILLYTAEKRAYLGFIPNDQAAFVDRLRKVIQHQKSTSALSRQSQTGQVGQPGMPGPQPSIAGGQPGMSGGQQGMGGSQQGMGGPGPSPQQAQQGMGGMMQQNPQQQQQAMNPGMGGGQGPNQMMTNMQPDGSQQQQVNPNQGQPGYANHMVEAARQENLVKIQRLQQTLEAAQQQELQYKNQLEVMSHMKMQQQMQDNLQHLQQQEMQYKQLEEQQKLRALQLQAQQQAQAQGQQQVRAQQVQVQQQQVQAQQQQVRGISPQQQNQQRMMRPAISNNPGLRHLLQQPQYRLNMQQQMPRPGMPNNGGQPQNPSQQQFDDVTSYDFLS